MNSAFFKRAFLFVVLFSVLFSVRVSALTARAFVVTLQSDTIWGYIQLSKFDKGSGGYLLSGIDEVGLRSMMAFKADGTSRLKPYYPEDLQGFCFIYDSKIYIYRQQAIQRKSIIPSERTQIKFVKFTCGGSELRRYLDMFQKSETMP